MPRLIDSIRAHPKLQMPFLCSPEFERKWIDHAKNIGPLLQDPDMPVLLIDNVAEYYYVGSDQEHWDLVRDFPNLAPPYPVCWIEHKLTTRIHSKEKGDSDLSAMIGHDGRVGILLRACDPAMARADGDLPAGTKWLLWAELFIDYGSRFGGYAQGPHGATFFCIDAEGRLLGKPWMQGFFAREHEEMAKLLINWFHPALLAISFLHCKNVEVIDNTVDKPLAKKHHAKHGLWPVKYKTLVIEPLKAILRHQGGSDQHGIAKAMHICRGHFRDYREGRGLFGRYHQLVWTPAIVRGTRGTKAPPREVEVKIQ